MPEPLVIYTSRISYGGPGRLDVTRAGGSVFGPSWWLLNDAKAGRLTFEQYRRRYLAEMRESYKRHHAQWMAVLEMERVVLCCYCRLPEECHRSLLAGLLVRAARRWGIQAKLGGEIT